MNAQQVRRSVADADCDMADAVLFADQAIEGRGYLDERERNLARCFKSLRAALEAERAEVERLKFLLRDERAARMAAEHGGAADSRARTLAEALRVCKDVLNWLHIQGGLGSDKHLRIRQALAVTPTDAALASVAEQPEDKET